MKLAILLVCYNRIESLKRLIKSLENSFYDEDDIDLIFSIDYSGDPSIEKLANEFTWKHGQKIVRQFKERQGLKQHILSCGNYLDLYDAIAVFEDDVFVSPSFYGFMKAATAFYKDDPQIAGISLYSHMFNVNAQLPFFPSKGKSDVFFMQFAQSWGQIWLKKQWFDFKKWLKSTEIVFDETTPDFVNSWPDKSSWLKLHIKYCVDMNKFFVYPYYSYTTCFSETGEHVGEKTSLQQVPIVTLKKESYSFEHLSHESILYDCFFERMFPGNILIDIYGLKQKLYYRKRFILTTNVLNFKIINSYALDIKPPELNFLYHISGSSLFLYDSKYAAKNNIKKNKENLLLYYYTFAHHWDLILKICFKKMLSKMRLKK
jgi:hypothetical protein